MRKIDHYDLRRTGADHSAREIPSSGVASERAHRRVRFSAVVANLLGILRNIATVRNVSCFGIAVCARILRASPSNRYCVTRARRCTQLTGPPLAGTEMSRATCDLISVRPA